MADDTPPQNPSQGSGDFAADAAVDTTADGVVNNALPPIEQKVPIPGGQAVDNLINTQEDQVANNAINQELNKGVGGIPGDVEGLLGGHEG